MSTDDDWDTTLVLAVHISVNAGLNLDKLNTEPALVLGPLCDACPLPPLSVASASPLFPPSLSQLPSSASALSPPCCMSVAVSPNSNSVGMSMKISILLVFFLAFLRAYSVDKDREIYCHDTKPPVLVTPQPLRAAGILLSPMVSGWADERREKFDRAVSQMQHRGVILIRPLTFS